MMDSVDEIEEMAKKEWYVQGLNSTPFLISSCGASAFDLTPSLGDTFSIILYDFQEERAEMFYPLDDLKRLGILIRKRLAEPGFLEEIRERYRTKCARDLACMERLRSVAPKEMSDERLVEALVEANRLQRTSVGQGHIIETFSLTTDEILKEGLGRHVQGKELNAAFALLTTPREKSFVQEREEDLQRIFRAPATERKALIAEHLRRFYWVRNSYASGTPITVKEIEEELENSKASPPVDTEQVREKQEQMLAKLGLDEELRRLLAASRFISAFQDERKKNILIGVSHADELLAELARRTGIDHKLLRYLDYGDDLAAMVKDAGLKGILERRRAGLLQVLRPASVKRYVDEDFARWRALRAAGPERASMKEFTGLSASSGSAIGPVKVCTSLKAIGEVQEGDILVASMTRPEYLPAMKKAAAIVTDEGGITSHAAIVSREMGKPCVIGTQYATKLLRDGDLVEVKANHGLVVIIERTGERKSDEKGAGSGGGTE